MMASGRAESDIPYHIPAFVCHPIVHILLECFDPHQALHCCSGLHLEEDDPPLAAHTTLDPILSTVLDEKALVLLVHRFARVAQELRSVGMHRKIVRKLCAGVAPCSVGRSCCGGG